MADDKKKEAPKEPEKPVVGMPMWGEYQISDPDHAHDLEQRAALHEFEHKLPKDQAAKRAHSEYKHEQHLKAAANHFAGMKAAKATGDHDEAKKHHAMYMLHLEQLGHDATGPLPREVEHHMGSIKNEPFYRFQAHKADGFLFNDGKKPDKKTKTEK